jgi:hypothetical protein
MIRGQKNLSYKYSLQNNVRPDKSEQNEEEYHMAVYKFSDEVTGRSISAAPGRSTSGTSPSFITISQRALSQQAEDHDFRIDRRRQMVSLLRWSKRSTVIVYSEFS